MDKLQENLLIRLFEIIFSITALIFSIPILVIAALGVLFEAGWPMFFLQPRVGKNIQKFSLFKLRTMKKGTESKGTHEISKDRWLKNSVIIRRLKIDEMPQFLNVLMGEMSIVGPRPCLQNQNELIEERGKYNLYSLKPGITGISQLLEVDMSRPKEQAKLDSIFLKDGINQVNLYFHCIVATAFKPLRQKLRSYFH